jgi:hypothetical protein
MIAPTIADTNAIAAPQGQTGQDFVSSSPRSESTNASMESSIHRERLYPGPGA